MDGAHDLGGMQGFGPVRSPGCDAAYHESWEPRAQFVALMSKPSHGSMRAHIEQLAPADYLALPYYARWLTAAEQFHVRDGSLSTADLERWYDFFAAHPDEVPPRRDDPKLAALVTARLSTGQPLPMPERSHFEPGEQVVVRRMHTEGHHRCPRYVRGVRGTVEQICGVDRVPGSDRRSGPHETVYTVAFGSRDLWGDTDDPPFVVLVDLWESYLEAAS
jgi:nitrile hydratase subunit beta